MAVRKTANGPKYWRSLEELADTPEFRRQMEREFPAGATEMLEPATRRNFLKLMGASLALAGIGMTSCRWPKEKIYPAAYQAPGNIPGTTKQFATAMDLGGYATGLLVSSYDGRPIKVEGNPSHPISGGRTMAWHQASLLDMYDPDRSRGPIQRLGTQAMNSTMADFRGAVTQLAAGMEVTGGEGLAVLSEANSSPTLADLRQRFMQRFPRATWHEYEPLSLDNEREGSYIVFGQPYRSHYEFSNARVVASIDSDFLMTHPASLKYTRDYSAKRKPGSPDFSRSYVFECNHSVTGAQADHRLALAPSDVGAVACVIAADLFVKRGLPLPMQYQGLLASLNGFASHPLASDPVVQALLEDLSNNHGASIVVAGQQQGAEIHALVHLINSALGNTGSTVNYTLDTNPARQSHLKEISTLKSALEAKTVNTLLLIGGNPVFDAPADLGFEAALRNAGTTIHLSHYDNETSQACQWHVNRAHFLESWGDGAAWDGTVSIVQPLIAPLYEGISEIELLSMLVDPQPLSGYELVRRTMQPLLGGDFEAAWRQVLHDGVLQGSASALASPAWTTSNFAWTLDQYVKPAADGSFDLLFAPSYSLYDGRFANNGWLLENPDPMSKCTWDNPVLMGLETAEKLGIRHGTVVNLELGQVTLEAPVYVLPGHGPGAVTVSLGYGRKAAVRDVNRGGWNTYALRGKETFYRSGGLKLSPTARKFELASVQDHWAIDRIGLKERARRVEELVREGTVEQHAADPGFVAHIGEPVENGGHWEQLWKDPVDYTQQTYRWGMAIDLNSCTGCGVCTVACQAENNIPVVGRKLVRKGREMHWIRVDRYFTGEDPNKAMAVSQPVPCQHCENAPCEQVCPVAATVHDHDGLNVMVYNRCVGTRYCSNNCPYKVRRFNWFNLHKHRGTMTPVEMMAMNPDVTVRSRGVMEKCSFCTQRIQAAKISAKNDRRPIQDGEVVPACAQACPADAIVFGDLNDPKSRISEAVQDNRTYAILGEINTRPRVRYQARLRNPNPALAAEYPVRPHADEHSHGDEHSHEAEGHAEPVGSSAEGGH
ncbi:TAT-variant-translocated molybdopterin oxidoreductase [bacterium]|nr:TAT-variant-translocated molybdopterin oxidoreductase [bacterium]